MTGSRRRAGVPERLAPGLRCVLAPNPSPMTEAGTNTYLVGVTEIAVIDPGPDHPGHLAAILAAVPAGGRVSHILVTHSHLDHSPLAAALARATGAPVLAFGGPLAGRSPAMTALAARGGGGGGEGVDTLFQPDLTLADGELIESCDWQLQALWTPGHFGNHLCFAWGDRVFSGDHVMAWASTLVSPPDGDMGDYMASLSWLARRQDRVFYPGHGRPVAAPQDRLAVLAQHRRDREAQIVAALGPGSRSIAEVLPQVYSDLAPALWPAAARNLFAHLVDLETRKLVTCEGSLHVSASFRRV